MTPRTILYTGKGGVGKTSVAAATARRLAAAGLRTVVLSTDPAHSLSDSFEAELTVPPGMDELFSLLQIKAHHESDEYDAIVVDCAPTGETLRLLSFPDVASWWLDKVFPWERRLYAAARPFARSLLDIPMPGEAVFDDVKRLVENLVAMNGILRDRSTTSIRLVMNPDRMVIKEAMRTFTYLNLYGYLTDAVIVNRVLP